MISVGLNNIGNVYKVIYFPFQTNVFMNVLQIQQILVVMLAKTEMTTKQMGNFYFFTMFYIVVIMIVKQKEAGNVLEDHQIMEINALKYVVTQDYSIMNVMMEILTS